MSTQHRMQIAYGMEVLAVALLLAVSMMALMGATYATAQATTGERLTRLDGEISRLSDRDQSVLSKVDDMDRRVEKIATSVSEMRDLIARTQGMIYMLSLLSGLCAFALLVKGILGRRGGPQS